MEASDFCVDRVIIYRNMRFLQYSRQRTLREASPATGSWRVSDVNFQWKLDPKIRLYRWIRYSNS